MVFAPGGQVTIQNPRNTDGRPVITGKAGARIGKPLPEEKPAYGKETHYDTVADIGETTNVADDHPEVVERLTTLLQQYVDEGRSTPGAPQENDRKVEFKQS